LIGIGSFHLSEEMGRYPHKLRHSYASDLLPSNIHPKGGKRLGHTSIAITMDICSHRRQTCKALRLRLLTGRFGRR
jgi:integrase